MAWVARGDRGRVLRAGARWWAPVLASLALLAAPAGASASLTWSASAPVDPHAAGIALSAVACASTSQCTAVDGQGREVTFNPASPLGASAATVSKYALTALACPAATQCTAVDVAGEEVTFNPQSPGSPAPVVVDTTAVPLAIACPTAGQCTLVDASGGEVTFDPQTSAVIGSAVVDPPLFMGLPNNVLVGVDCPAATQCSAVDATFGEQVTFDPQNALPVISNGTADSNTSSTVEPAAIACPGTQCVVVDTGGGEATFSPTSQSSTTIDGSGTSAVALTALSCASATECIAVDVQGNEVDTNPQNFSANQKPAAVDPGQLLISVSCPAANQCTAVDRSGAEITFNPATPGTPTPVVIDGTTKLTGVACPSTTECSVIDASGQEATFAPGSSAAPIDGVIDSGTHALYGVSCPAGNQCTAVDAEGREVTFTPQSPASPARSTIDAGHTLYAVACPVLTQCTAVDDDGAEITFNPQAPAPHPATLEAGDGLLGVACPLATQCTAIDDRGDAIMFNPQAPANRRVRAIDSSPDVALTCPSVTECVAISAAGGAVSFNPQLQGPPPPRVAPTIDTSGQPDAVACRTPTDCVAVDTTGGVSEGDPNGVATWPMGQLPATGPLDGVACPSPFLCVAIDSSGHAFLGSGGPLPPVPGGLTAPVITGTAKQGQQLTASNGSWSHGPTSYAYQWLRCTGTGGACAIIPAAVGQSYTLLAADVGHKLRVSLSASNITGAGATLTSGATKLVRPLVPVAVSRASLTGIGKRRPRLTFTLTAGPGEPAVKTFTVTVRGVTIVASGSHRLRRGVAIARHARFAATVRGQRLTITLTRPVGRVRVTISRDALAASKALARRARAHKVHAAQLLLTVVETGSVRTRLKVPLAVT